MPASPETLHAVAALAGVKAEDVQTTPIAGIFEVLRGSDILYMTRDGQYAFTGDLYQVPNRANLTEVHRREMRRKLIEAVPESRMVVFSPPDPKYTVTVFTDVDCSYCRALHRQIAEYNRLGVRVRYVFYPRTGPDTDSWHKAEQVWCSADRKAALTRAKLGEALNSQPCTNTPVAQEYELGQGHSCLDGTPGIVRLTARWWVVTCRPKRWSNCSGSSSSRSVWPKRRRASRPRRSNAPAASACRACPPTPWHRPAPRPFP